MMKVLSPAALDLEVIARFEDLSKMMSRAQDKWVVIGGAALVLMGVSGVPVRDIDVVLSVRDAEAILTEMGIELLPPSPNAHFRSRVYAQIGGAIQFDLMADFSVSSARGWVHVVPNPAAKMLFAGHPVFLPARQEMAQLLELFGRPKDMERLQLLQTS